MVSGSRLCGFSPSGWLVLIGVGVFELKLFLFMYLVFDFPTKAFCTQLIPHYHIISLRMKTRVAGAVFLSLRGTVMRREVWYTAYNVQIIFTDTRGERV